MPKHVLDALRHARLRKFIQMLPILWVVTHASNVQRGYGQTLAVPLGVEKCHVMCVVCQDLLQQRVWGGFCQSVRTHDVDERAVQKPRIVIRRTFRPLGSFAGLALSFQSDGLALKMSNNI